jgi:exopolysaccharide biosynthesis polyprenyl glycosylphosphotransferase
MFTHAATKRHGAPRDTQHDAEPARRFGRSGAARSRQAAGDLVVEPAGARSFPRDVLFRRLLLVADLTAASVAACSVVMAFGSGGPGPAVLVLLAIVPVVFTSMGLYRRDELVLSTNTLDEGPLLFQAATLSTLAAYLLESAIVATPLGAQQIALVLVVLTGSAALFRVVARDAARRLSPPERCLLIGGEDIRARLSSKFAAAPTVKAKLIGQVPLETGADAKELTRRISEDDVDRVVVAGEGAPPERVHHVIQSSKALGVKVSLLPRMFEVVGSSVAFDYFGGMTVLGVRRFGLSRRQRVAKRAFDLVGSIVLMVLLAPLTVLIALAVRLTSSGPVLFRQLRVGRDDKHFELLKFRSMCVDADARKDDLLDRNEADGLFKIDDDPRVTRVGRLLRRTCLDELPQLINVVRGEMSLVGPRPLVLPEDERIQGFYRSRLHLMPGMTGPWQVLGSARIPLHEMMSIDYLYVANWSLWGDIKILLRTVPVVMLRRGQ